MAYGSDSSLRRESAKLGVKGIYNRNGEFLHGLDKKKKESLLSPENVGKGVGIAAGATKGGLSGKKIGDALTPAVAAIPGVGPAIAPFSGAIGAAIGTGLGGYIGSAGGSAKDLEGMPDDIGKIRELIAATKKAKT